MNFRLEQFRWDIICALMLLRKILDSFQNDLLLT